MPEYGNSWCEFHDLPRNVCPHAVDKAVLAAFDNRRVVIDDLVADGPTITASQTTDCPGCTRKIVPDEQITHTEHGWAHAEHVGPTVARQTNDVEWDL